MNLVTSNNRLDLTRLIIIPSVIILFVTLFRLTGELRHWSRVLFNPAAGGGGAIIGISWLVPVFGIYFALKLSAAGTGPASVGRANLLALVGLIMMVGGAFVDFAPQLRFPGKIVLGLLLIVAAAALQNKAWPALSKVLLAYTGMRREFRLPL